MTRTSPLVSFGLFALALKQDSIPACDDVQTFSIVDDLRTGNVTTKPYITYEPDFWLLDGNYKFKPSTTVHIGLMSLSMSNASGVFAIPPELVRRMDEAGDKQGQEETGVAIAVEMMEKLKRTPGINGMHIMAIHWEIIVPRLIEAAGLRQPLVENSYPRNPHLILEGVK